VRPPGYPHRSAPAPACRFPGVRRAERRQLLTEAVDGRAGLLGLTLLCGAGFDLGPALDTLNALTLFTVAHAASEVSTTAVNSAAAVGSQDWVAGLDDQEFPLLAAAARSSAGTDDSTRFEFAIAAFIRGVAPAAS
jgi:hypothetical protein